MCEISGLPPVEVFGRAQRREAGSTPGTAAEGCTTEFAHESTEQLPWRAGWRSSRLDRAGWRSTATVDASAHRGSRGSSRRHGAYPRRCRNERAGSPMFRCRSHSSHSRRHRPHPRGGGDLALREPKHTARLQTCARPHDPSLQGQLGKMGLDAPQRRCVGRQRSRRHADGGSRSAVSPGS